MNDNYLAVYNAVRSPLSECDVGEVIRRAFDISYAVQQVQQEMVNAAFEHQRPSAVYRPRLFVDGSLWCALYGDNLQSGLVGFGETPSAAMYDFDSNWHKQLTKE